MLQFDQATQKGLFTFYREQQQFQQQLAREKKQRIRKKKQKKEELQKQKIKDAILQEQQDKIHKENDNVTLIKANTQPVIRKNKLGTAVVVITSKHKKKKAQSLEKKPLSVMMFDPKIQRAPEFLLPKSEFAFNNSTTDNHLELKEIYLSGLDQQLNAHINNSISQARQRRIHKKKYHHKEQKSRDKEDLSKYRIAIDSIAKGLLKDSNSILKLPSVAKNNSQLINNRISLNNDHKILLKLNSSTSLQPKPKKRYSSNDLIDNSNIAKIQGLLSLQKYKDSIANTKQQQPYKSKSIVNKIKLQRSLI